MATALNSIDMPPSMALESTVSVVEALLEDSFEEDVVVVVVEVLEVDGIMGATSMVTVAGGGVWLRYWAMCRSLRRKPDFS